MRSFLLAYHLDVEQEKLSRDLEAAITNCKQHDYTLSCVSTADHEYADDHHSMFIRATFFKGVGAAFLCFAIVGGVVWWVVGKLI